MQRTAAGSDVTRRWIAEWSRQRTGQAISAGANARWAYHTETAGGAGSAARGKPVGVSRVTELVEA
jgi:hypothetical protein